MMRAGLILSMLTLTLSARAQSECPDGMCGPTDGLLDRGPYLLERDFDGDGIEDEYDNCLKTMNYPQADADGDTVGDVCDVCFEVADPYQLDLDGDRMGDLCDDDLDGDFVPNRDDNCAWASNMRQLDNDRDALGDACDDDDDNDGIPDFDDGCRLVPGNDWAAEGCDDDADHDGIPTFYDNCPYVVNTTIGVDGQQLDKDGDGLGDACDQDLDGDDILNNVDNCTYIYNPDQIDQDRDGLGDAGNWDATRGACDPQECYVVGDNDCLDPYAPLSIALLTIGDRRGGYLYASPVTIIVASNKLGQLHRREAEILMAPSGNNAQLINAAVATATSLDSPQLLGCIRMEEGECVENDALRLEADVEGRYRVVVRVWLHSDPDEVAIAYRDIEIDGSGGDPGYPVVGCNCDGVPGSSLAVAGLLCFVLCRRRASLRVG